MQTVTEINTCMPSALEPAEDGEPGSVVIKGGLILLRLRCNTCQQQARTEELKLVIDYSDIHGNVHAHTAQVCVDPASAGVAATAGQGSVMAKALLLYKYVAVCRGVMEKYHEASPAGLWQQPGEVKREVSPWKQQKDVILKELA